MFMSDMCCHGTTSEGMSMKHALICVGYAYTAGYLDQTVGLTLQLRLGVRLGPVQMSVWTL